MVIEDDESNQDRYGWFFGNLNAAIFEWRLAGTGEAALGLIERKPFELIVLDMHLPGLGGVEILRWREAHPLALRIPVLVVSGESGTPERVRGIDLGADDYLVKPYSDDELKARLLALKRRQDRLLAANGFYDLGWLRFDPETCKVTVDGAPTHMEAKELDLLAFFLRRPRMVHRSRALWEMFWEDESAAFEHVLGNKISLLRGKLGRGGSCLQNHKAIGYSTRAS